MKGEPVAVFFGFTHCPDVCPTTLLDWSNVLAGLGKDGDRLKVLFVSVDGERDTPAALPPTWPRSIRASSRLTGGAAEIARAARAFDALYERVAGGDGGYSFDHTTKVYLIGRDGRLAATADLQTPEAERRKMLAGLLSGSEPGSDQGLGPGANPTGPSDRLGHELRTNSRVYRCAARRWRSC